MFFSLLFQGSLSKFYSERIKRISFPSMIHQNSRGIRMASFLRALCLMSVLSRSEALPHLPRIFASKSESNYEQIYAFAGKMGPVTSILAVVGGSGWTLYNAVTSSKAELKNDMAQQEARLEASINRQEASMARQEASMARQEASIKTDIARQEANMARQEASIKTDLAELKNEFRSDMARRLGKLEGFIQNERTSKEHNRD